MTHIVEFDCGCKDIYDSLELKTLQQELCEFHGKIK